MSPPQYCTPAQLADLFKGCQGEIIDEWRARAGELLQELDLTKSGITDHLPDVVAEITRDLALGRDGVLSEEHTRGSPPVHGVQRFYDGLDIGEVVAEYNLLRVAFNTVAERHHLHIAGEAARIINHRIDEAIRLAVTAFSAQQALIRHEREAQHIAFVAHDLRTPLNAIGLLVWELKDGLDLGSHAGAGELFEILQRNLERVEQLIVRVMQTVAKPSGNGSSFQPERRVFELWPLVQRLILDLGKVSSKASIAVVNKVPTALTVFADAGLISQVFQNLMDNAFKYAPCGRVVISATENEDGSITCCVQDNGAGIPPEMLSSVFDTHVTDPDGPGTGLGLAIVKQIVEAHGGTIAAESTLGEGATFCFSIPAPAA